jgi:hypothetical protein
MGFKFYTKSLLIIDHMGESEDIMGTNTPITSAPRTAPKVGTMS